MIKIIGTGNGTLIVELRQKELQDITGTNGTFEVGQEVEVGPNLSVVHQLAKKKARYTALLSEISNTIDQLNK